MSRPRLIALLLALATLLIYLPAARHGFSLFDDTDYVTENRVVQDGLTWAGVRWAFTTWHASNWHPLTWLSHMLDCELFGLNAGAHHFINLLLHAANAALLFTLLRRLTGALWASAFIAALFAWHPLRVESVAWIAERKDVLSTFFALLALLAYVAAASDANRRPRRATVLHSHLYWLALLFFGLGLLAKPMLVTLPLVMLLLDYWPLRRAAGSNPATAQPTTFYGRLLVEKTPFFLLVAASCVVTFLAQHHGGMVVPLDEMPLGYRLANVPLAYLRYLEKLLWPAHLAILYPLPKTLSPIAVVFAVAALLLATGFAARERFRHPYLLVGWLWFLGTLVPVIGLVQVGRVAMSDRYSYFPLIGISIAAVFAIGDGVRRFRVPPVWIYAGAGVILGSCVWLTEKQLTFWRDDVALFSHAVNVTSDNEPAHVCLGLALEAAGRKTDALAEYRAGLKLNPYRVKTYNYAADALADAGQTNAALNTLREGLRVSPKDAPTHDRLARLLADSGHPNEALAEFQTALELNPQNTTTLNNRGMVLVALGRFDEAMQSYAEAARLDSANWHSPYLTGLALLKQNRDAEAIPYFRLALQKNPDDPPLLVFLARVLASDENANVRDGGSALNFAAQASALIGNEQPDLFDVTAMAYAELGRFEDAQKAAQAALRLCTTTGQTNEMALMQQRLQLYQNHQPFRQSFDGSTNGGPQQPQP